jgi:uncharacterized membrane protein (UPF0136 family)
VTETRHLHTHERRLGERRSNWRAALLSQQDSLLRELGELLGEMQQEAGVSMVSGAWAGRVQALLEKYRARTKALGELPQ